INLAQLRDDLFGLVLLLGHSNVLSNGSRAYFREDHFSGGRPRVACPYEVVRLRTAAIQS
ncbi:hypothetical protein, partial [Pseudaminobacter soli (ex Li et al. 2025)]|uniref:hypothetical protein n=1 Tax=Pseudaminobacter soli (ex Li et al. 2025) TaxID=1295366 RepID=UPI001AED0D3D